MSKKKRKRSTRPGTRRFTLSMQRKLMVMFGLIVAAFLFLSVRIFLINRDNGTEYTMQVLSQQSYTNRTIPYRRGKIMDCKGTVLADSTLVYNVIIDAKQILSEDRYLEPSLDAAETLGLNKAQLRKFIQENESSQYYIAKKNVAYQEKKDYEAWLAEGIEQENSLGLKDENAVFRNVVGIWFEPGYIRTYPSGAAFADLIGFANTANVGSFGIEEYYNDILNGTEGRTYGYLDDNLNLEQTTIDAQNGSNLTLTVDSNIQNIVMKHLNKFGEKYKNKDHKGNGANNIGCIIQNVHTGEILAMGSYPGFDLSDPYDKEALIGMPVLSDKDEATDKYLTKKDVEALSDNDQIRYFNSLWRNYCISSHYEPGSTAKTFTVAAGLESGRVKEDDTFLCEGSLTVGGSRIRCHNVYGDGTLTVGEAVERSCNVALMKMAEQLGNDEFTKYQNVFNFGLRTGIDLADEARTSEYLYSAASMGEADLATNSFGQNFEVTMIQMITAFSSVVNGGIYYEPHVVSRITSSGGAVISTTEPRVLKKTVSEETSKKLREYLIQVVEGDNGTGKTARPAGYRIGGKTGTAETLPRGNGEYVVSFMGFAPAEDPQIAIYVVVDRPNVEKGERQADAKFATGIVRSILTEVLPYMNIYMTQPLSDAEKKELQALGLKDTTSYSRDK